MTTKAPPAYLPGSLPIAPTEDEWQKMTLEERERLLEKIHDSLSAHRRWMSQGRLTGMVEELEAKAQLAEAKAEQAAAKAEQATLREAVLAVLDARGIACPDHARERLMSCDDPSVLRRWLSRATSAGSAAEAFEG